MAPCPCLAGDPRSPPAKRPVRPRGCWSPASTQVRPGFPTSLWPRPPAKATTFLVLPQGLRNGVFQFCSVPFISSSSPGLSWPGQVCREGETSLRQLGLWVNPDLQPIWEKSNSGWFPRKRSPVRWACGDGGVAFGTLGCFIFRRSWCIAFAFLCMPSLAGEALSLWPLCPPDVALGFCPQRMPQVHLV